MGNYATADQTLVRRMNTALVLDCLRTAAPISRAALSVRTGLNRSTISSVINELLKDNLVCETGRQTPGGGRPGILLELNPAGGGAIGVEIGVTSISIILANLVAHPLWHQRRPLAPGAAETAVLAQAETMIEAALAVAGQNGLRVLGIGVGVPGLVDIAQGEVVFAANLGWSKVGLRQSWTTRFNLPVFVENEANAAALGEYYVGAAGQTQNFIYLSAGVGLGSGIIIDGQLFRGSRGYAGEVGHMIVEPGGERCSCGKRGCWETVVGPRAIVQRVRRKLAADPASQLWALSGANPDRIDLDMILQAAAAGDGIAGTALAEVGVQLGRGIANLINIFNPERVVLGGVLSLAGPFILPAIDQAIRDHALPQCARGLKIQVAVYGPDACAMGALTLVLDNVFHEPAMFV